MARKYKRVSDRGKYGQEALSAAMEAIKNGCSLKKAERDFGVPRKTLRRHRDSKVTNPGKVSLGGAMTALQEDFERQLVSHVQSMEKAFFGFTTVDIRKLAYQLAEKLDMKHKFNKSSKMAGVDWMRGFLLRHPQLSIRSPQATNISRAIGFNRPKVNQFFQLYRDLLKDKNICNPSKIWNMDETGITTVQKPCKILATRGKRQVSKMTSAERGQLVTIVCAMNASGSYLPPTFIFPRARMSDLLMKGAPVGSFGTASSSGWTDSDVFVTFLRHFVKSTGCSQNNQHVLILDGHHSHKSLDAIVFAKENGIHMITFPPHCTHKLQPLDRTFFKSLKANYNRSADGWMTSNPGKRISVYDVAGIFASAYNHAANVQKAVKGFECTGLWPVNELVFNDEDFAATELTEEPDPNAAQVPDLLVPNSASSGVAVVPEKDSIVANEPATESTSSSTNMDLADESEPVQNTLVPEMQPSPAVFVQSVSVPLDTPKPHDGSKTADPSPHPGLAKALEILAELSPKPKIQTSRIRKRKSESATILTSSPFKKQVEEKMRQKVNATGSRKLSKNKTKPSSTFHKQKKSPKEVKNRKTGADSAVWRCAVCRHEYGRQGDPKITEEWTWCKGCACKFHLSCAEESGIFEDDETFTCKTCV